MKTLYVRVQPKSGQESFFRCGMKFSQKWQKVENVDNATARRLAEEQMLEVSETEPAELDSVAQINTPTTSSTAGSGSGTSADAPLDPAVRLEAIQAAIGQLNKEDAALWTAGGKAKTEAIAAITGWSVTAAERDAATVAEA